MAVIASEDNRFAEHNGFDFKEIEKALEENKNRKRPRGASTISQQTAKNIFCGLLLLGSEKDLKCISPL